MTDQEKYVLSEIIRITGDSKSRTFWIKAIKEIGCSRVEQDLGELKYQTHKEEKRNPGAYLTTLLKQRMNLNTTAGKKATLTKPAEKLNTYFEKTQQDLFRHLKPVPIPQNAIGELENMPNPYSGKNIPWPTFIGPEFFTLSTDKRKSDKINAQFRSLDGNITEVPLIRGKISPDSKKEFGIPNIQHWRVLCALQIAWAQKQSGLIKYENRNKICSVTVSAKELAKILGWKNWQHLGKENLRWLRDKIAELKAMPYHLLLEALGLKDLKGFGFYLIGDVCLLNIKARRGEETIFNVSFSSTVSWQLLNRHAVTRAKEMIHIHSELACKLWMYLEPILRKKEYHNIGLKNLIKLLHLPETDWHKSKSHRKQVFSKALKELNGQKIADGRKILISIGKGLDDWQLEAWLEGLAIKQLEN